MSKWQWTTHAEVCSQFDDDYLRYAVSDDQKFLICERGWAVTHPWFDDDWFGGCSVLYSSSMLPNPNNCDDPHPKIISDLEEIDHEEHDELTTIGQQALDLLARNCREQGKILHWYSSSTNLVLQAPAGYRTNEIEDWRWMSTNQVHNNKPLSIDLVELDDHNDAQEIIDFAAAHNPLYGGHPGQGLTGLWLGYRENSQLLATGAIEVLASGFPHLAGLLVHPNLRGTGLGREIIWQLSARAIERYGATTLGVYANNAHAIKLYRGIGYAFERRYRNLHLLADKT